MRRLLAVVLLVAACSNPPSPPAGEIAEDVPQGFRTAPVTDLHFSDYQLQAIATKLVREARARGIEVSSGRNRIERLLSLEASLGSSTFALVRVNSLVAQITATDVGPWAKLRRRADLEFSRRDDELARRVRDMLTRWQREKSEAALRYLSSNYTYFISRVEWERRFHDFVSARPMDAATWGWLILREESQAAAQHYGRADSETAYRFYLELSGLGDAREAREIFAVPGVEILEAP